jgi:hypothetical protein
VCRQRVADGLVARPRVFETSNLLCQTTRCPVDTTPTRAVAETERGDPTVCDHDGPNNARAKPRECQRARLPNGAAAKRRGCQTARLPKSAAAEERSCRGAQLPKSAAAQRCGGPRKSTDATMNRSDCGNDRPAREHQASVCVKTQSVEVRALMCCEKRESHRMDRRSYSPRDGHDSADRRRGAAQRQPDHSLRRTTRHEREYNRSTRRSGRPLRAGDVTMNRSCRTLNPSARRDRGERTAQ